MAKKEQRHGSVASDKDGQSKIKGTLPVLRNNGQFSDDDAILLRNAEGAF